jgi:hypothetical protein
LKTVEINPKYKLNQIVEIRSLKINMPVIITRAMALVDYDTNKIEYHYNFKHYSDRKDAWTWANVDEGSLEEMMWSAKNSKENGK